jgi:hypothetical protein
VHQPPRRASEVPRRGQAEALHAFVEELLDAEPEALLVVMGDLNDFGFSEPVRTLAGERLVDPARALPEVERYSYVYQGNSQQLDHILLSPGLHARMTGFEIVHVNSEYSRQASDHDPCVARFAPR